MRSIDLVTGALESNVPLERAEMILDRALREIADFRGRPMTVRPRPRILWRIMALHRRVCRELRDCQGEPGADQFLMHFNLLIGDMLEA